MRTAIFGGTFNPIHNGHLYMSEELRVQMGYDRVIFVPSNIPAHKPSDELIPTIHRIKMLELALEGSGSILDMCEIDRGGVSYTFDTVRFIKNKYKIKGKPGLFIGDDLAGSMNEWHRSAELLEEVDIVIAYRSSDNMVQTGFNHRYMKNIFVEISSSFIRDRIRRGEAFRYLIPESVYGYIVKKGLYK